MTPFFFNLYIMAMSTLYLTNDWYKEIMLQIWCYIFEHNGVPDTFETDTEYGWFIRYPGYTCANVVFDKATKTVKEFNITERDGALGTIFKIPSPELTTLVLNKFKGKPLSC